MPVHFASTAGGGAMGFVHLVRKPASLKQAFRYPSLIPAAESAAEPARLLIVARLKNMPVANSGVFFAALPLAAGDRA